MIRDAAKLLGEAVILLVVLWSVGACAGVVAVGYRMIVGP